MSVPFHPSLVTGAYVRPHQQRRGDDDIAGIRVCVLPTGDDNNDGFPSQNIQTTIVFPH